ncbi:MAG: phytanoyl-CoA dioxygenase family protein [Methylococcales bacterium]
MTNLKLMLRHIIKMPIWLLALFTGAKSFTDNPVIGSYFLNRLGLHLWRVKLANYLVNFRRFFLKKSINHQKQLEYLQNGYIKDSDFLNKVEFEAIKKEVFESTWLLREMKQGASITRRVFLNEAELRSTHPKLAAFITNPELIARIRYVAGIGGEPIFSLQAILSEANANNDPQTVVHADTFHANAKAWFFLENVGEDDGPFAYVPGSHKLSHKRLNWEYQQSLMAKYHPIVYHARGSFRATEQDLQTLGLPSPQKMTVSENTLIVADTFGFHCRSSSPRATCRVEIYATLRRNPFLPWVGLDLFSIPYLRKRSGDFSIILLSQLAKIGLRKMPWQPVGLGKINQSSIKN